ncbi:LysM peptidoglycan-binding domain-containing protein [Alkalibacillus haloalkaliphilus]|uniref:LysM peptidoglycan-binding domain-containing protein n=1 Tax=Alkalibacillus haloalkaliphilus TaxID=94136 RepID=UPI0029362631|nr:LysM peptidoglycan-binding domain-containing protein [Alkalibacillus haloalkaliphilus]MDV2581131.1 LysM peptidoglycan-binding domain-containing protein [Alkalibacillus haloalkaliphilus]
MSNYEQVPYQFEVRENINFKRGEEIDDLYSIAIDPDVKVIHESNYVQIRGVLVVRGDYQTTNYDQESQYIVDDEDFNTVQQVRTLDNGFMEFQYPIPIDITIPHNRLRTDDHIQVVIDYFDYELPESKTLKVYSNVRLDGTEMVEVAEERYDEEEADSDFELKEFPTMQDEDYEHDDGQDHEYNEYDEYEQEDQHDTDVETYDEPDVDSDEEKGRDFWKKKDSQSLHEFFNKKDEKVDEDTTSNVEEVNVSAMPEETDDDADADDNHDYYDHHDGDTDTDTDTDTIAEADDAEEKVEQKESKAKKGLSYLSKFFREDEEKGTVQMRMRFVQEDDTLESIANYYQVSVSKLERLNGLEAGDTLSAGDVIYVPGNVKQSSEH